MQHFYTPVIVQLERNQESNAIYNSYKISPGINLIKKMKNSYCKNCKTVVKEILDNIHTKMKRYHLMDQKNIVKMSILPKLIDRFKTISIKIPMILLFMELEKNTCKVHTVSEKIPSSQSNPEQKE